jgi:Concanavalin A-like lectin/glucanases superfamily
VVFRPEAEAVPVPAATADYRFQGSFGSKVGAARDLVEIGEGTSAFTDEGMIGRAVLSFARGSGLSLTPTSVIEGTDYTIEVLFRFDRVDDYRKIIDFREGSDDNGLYVLDGCLNFYPRRPRSSLAIEADSYVQVVLSRDSSARVVGYVDGIRQFAFRDTAALAEIASESLRFFVDDSVTEGEESSSGAVSQIRLYDRPLTANQVAALACAEIRVPLATHPCPDPR